MAKARGRGTSGTFFLAADTAGLEIEGWSAEGGRVALPVAPRRPRARCPPCGGSSDRVHSRYRRTVADLPRHGVPVTLSVRARRFFCDEPSCERKIFCERLPDVAAHEKAYLGRLCAADEALADARGLTQAFAKMTRDLEGGKPDRWLEEAEPSKAPAMRRFAAVLKKNLAAVRAGLTERWTNGPVEGFVHKLKLLKRQGYGRVGFDLLRAMMLAAERPVAGRCR